LSRADKTVTNAWYEIEIDPKTALPVRVKVTVLTGRKGATVHKDGKIIGGEHVAFHSEYFLSGFDRVKEPKIPDEARKLLAKP
jgi:hypothetical protein